MGANQPRHRLGGVLLHRRHRMRVPVEGERHRAMPEALLYDLRVNARRQRSVQCPWRKS